MTALPHVALGQPHVAAHNDERDAIDLLTADHVGVADLAAAASSVISFEQFQGRKHRALQHYHQALGRLNSDPVDVMFAAGDSLFASNGATTFANTLYQKFAYHHRKKHPQTPVGGIGNITPTFYGSAAVGVFPDVPLAYVPDGFLSPANGTPGYGLSSSSIFLASAAHHLSFIFTGTGIDLCWFGTATGAAAATLKVDGTTYGVYNTGTKALTAGAGNITSTNTGANTLAHGKIRGLTAGAHTVDFAWVSGVFYVNDAFAYNGDEAAGCRVACQGYSGRGTRNYTGLTKGGVSAGNPFPTVGQAEQFRQNIRDGSYLPDLIFLDNQANDYAGTAADLCSVAENKSNLQDIISHFKADVAVGCAAAGVGVYIPSFVVTPVHCVVTSNIGGPSGSGGTMVANWTDYLPNMYNIQATDPDSMVALFDMGQRLQAPSNVWDNITYQGLLWTDHIHHSDEGIDWWAEALVNFVAPN